MYPFRFFLILAILISGCRSDYEPKNTHIDAFTLPKLSLIGEDIRDYILYEAGEGKSYEYKATVTPDFEGKACFTLSYSPDSPFDIEAVHTPDSTGMYLSNKCIYTNRYVYKNEPVTLAYTLTFTRPLVEKPKYVSCCISFSSHLSESPEWEFDNNTRRYLYQGRPIQSGIGGNLYIALSFDMDIFKDGNHYAAPAAKGY